MDIVQLRSPRAETGGICYFARMIDKIRLHSRGELPEEYQANLGDGFDSRCVSFLRVPYSALVEQVRQHGGTDEELLEWCFEHGRRPELEEIEVWNGFMQKRGWRDEMAERLAMRKRESGFQDRADIQTLFDYIDLDEGRDPALA